MKVLVVGGAGCIGSITNKSLQEKNHQTAIFDSLEHGHKWAMGKTKLGEAHDPESHIIPLFIKRILANKDFSIFGADYKTKDGTCVRDYIHVLDLADAHIKAVEHFQCGNWKRIFK